MPCLSINDRSRPQPTSGRVLPLLIGYESALSLAVCPVLFRVGLHIHCIILPQTGAVNDGVAGVNNMHARDMCTGCCCIFTRNHLLAALLQRCTDVATLSPLYCAVDCLLTDGSSYYRRDDRCHDAWSVHRSVWDQHMSVQNYCQVSTRVS